MKKIFLLIVVVLLMVGCGSESKNRDDNCVYNNFYWGDDKENVIAEKGEPKSYRPDNSIEYDESFMIDDCRTFYYFDEDWKLYKIKVSVTDTFIDYDDIRSMLVEMYGEPLSEETDEDNFKYLNWERGNTNIELCVLDGLNAYSVDYLYKVS